MATAVTARTVGTNSRSGTNWLRARAKQVDFNQPAVSPEVAVAAEVEAWLADHGVKYAPPAAIPMHLIDEKRSRSNQARREPIVPESVDRFAAAMKEGAVFPPIVVYADSGRLVIIDGNNRQAAAKRIGADTINGIMIAEETPSEVILALTVAANVRHGVTPPLDWRIQQAFTLSASGWNDLDAARAAGLTPAQLRSARTVREVEDRGRALKVSGFAELPASSKTVLAAVKDDSVFIALAKAAIVTRMTSEEIREVTRLLRGLSSESARLEAVANVVNNRTPQATAHRAAPGKHSRIHSPRVALAAGLGKVAAIDESALLRQLVTAHDREAVRKSIEKAEAKLHRLKLLLDGGDA